MGYKVAFFDIDGTILKSDHTYSEKTKDAIQQLKAQNIEVFLATGRPIHELQQLGYELGIDSYIGYNGAHGIYNNQSIVNEPMEEKLVREIVNIAKEHEHEVVMFSNKSNYFTHLHSEISQHFSKVFQMTLNKTYTEEIANQILGLTIMNLKPTDNKLYQNNSSIRLSQVNVEGVGHAYDVIRLHVNKGEAVKRVLEKLNIKKEEAIAFGDGMNDKEMLQVVGEGFAMGNAMPELFQYVNRKTTSVNEDGIYHGLKELGLVK